MSEIENSKNMTFNERKDKVMHIIIENRLKKNTIGGYWSLEFSKDAIENCVNGFININNDMKIMMTSDGFFCGRKPGEQSVGRAWQGQAGGTQTHPSSRCHGDKSPLGNSVARQLAPVKSLQALGCSMLG